MKRITIGFDNDTYKILQEHYEKTGININEYVRDLVDIGLRVEAMNADSDEKKSGLEDLDVILKMIKAGLQSNQETLYLVRYIISNLPNHSTQKNEEIRSEAKIKAETYVDGILA